MAQPNVETQFNVKNIDGVILLEEFDPANLTFPNPEANHAFFYITDDGSGVSEIKIKKPDGTENRFVSVAENPTVVETTSYTVPTSDSVILADDDTAGAPIEVTLPSPTNNSGLLFNIKKTGSTAKVTIIGTIDDGTNAVLTSKGESLTLYCNGTQYLIL